MTGLIPVKAGRVGLAGDDLRGLAPWERQRKGRGTSLQSGIVFPGLPVENNLRLAATGVGSGERPGRIDDVLDCFPALRQRLRTAADRLRGGEQRMLSVAMALIPRPSCLILDEPSVGLSPVMMHTVFDQLLHIREEFQTSILLIEQNAMSALKISDWAHVLRAGNIHHCRLEALGVLESLAGRGDLSRQTGQRDQCDLAPSVGEGAQGDLCVDTGDGPVGQDARRVLVRPTTCAVRSFRRSPRRSG